MHTNTILLYLIIIVFSVFTLCDTTTYIHPPALLGAMSSQTGARGASRSRGRLQPRTDPELRSDSERLANDQKRVAAKAAKSNFTIRGGAAPRGSSVTKTGDAAARSQAGQRARGSEQKQYSGTSRGRGARVDGSSSRGVARIQAANDNENADLKPKGDGIKGHFVEYLSGGSSSRGGSSTRGSARGGFTSKPGSRTQNDRTPSTKSSTKSSSTAGSRGQAWRDPRQEGNGNYMQSMADLFQTVWILSSPFTNWEGRIVTCVSPCLS